MFIGFSVLCFSTCFPWVSAVLKGFPSKVFEAFKRCFVVVSLCFEACLHRKAHLSNDFCCFLSKSLGPSEGLLGVERKSYIQWGLVVLFVMV